MQHMHMHTQTLGFCGVHLGYFQFKKWVGCVVDQMDKRWVKFHLRPIFMGLWA